MEQQIELLKSRINCFSFEKNKFVIKNKIVIFLKIDGLKDIYKYEGQDNWETLKIDFAKHIASSTYPQTTDFSYKRILIEKIKKTQNNLVIVFSVKHDATEKLNIEFISELEKNLENENNSCITTSVVSSIGGAISTVSSFGTIYQGDIGSQINKDLTLPLKIYINETLPLGFSLY